MAGLHSADSSQPEYRHETKESENSVDSSEPEYRDETNDKEHSQTCHSFRFYLNHSDFFLKFSEISIT